MPASNSRRAPRRPPPRGRPPPVGGEAGPFDPASAKVDDVLAYVANVNEEEKARVIDAEKKGKNRKTLLEKLEG
jgi:trigger factor